MFQETLHPAWSEINLTNLDYNIKSIKKNMGNRRMIGVVKADGYGHGSVNVAKVLENNGCDCFAVANIREAKTLRDAGFTQEIICLGLVADAFVNAAVETGITPVVGSLRSAKAFSEARNARPSAGDNTGLTKGNLKQKILIAADTGMGRIGYLCDTDEHIKEAVCEVKKIASLPNIEIEGIISHFSTADAADKGYSKVQEQRFKAFVDALETEGITLPMKTLANSAATMEIPTAYFNAYRPGIILYGCYPSDEVDRSLLSLKPVMSIKAAIVNLKEIAPGETVGYGRKFTAKRPTKIATLAIGYADGFPRTYSPFGKVIINGVYAPLAGNICMDQCMVDVTDVPDVALYDEAIIMGSDGKLSITADDIAGKIGTISYEILCGFRQRLTRVYIK